MWLLRVVHRIYTYPNDIRADPPLCELPHRVVYLAVTVCYQQFGVLYATAFMFHGLQWELFASLGAMLVALWVRFQWNMPVPHLHPRSHGYWHLLAGEGLALLWIGITP